MNVLLTKNNILLEFFDTRSKMRNYIKKNGFYILCVCIIIVPILIYASKSIPAADDYANAVSVSHTWNTSSNTLSATLCHVVKSYKSMSGYFFAAFLNFLFTPMLRGGVAALRFFNVISNIIFFLSLFFFLRVLNKKLLKVGYNWPIFCVMVAMLVNGYPNMEIYTWYCVQVAYILPISIMFMSLAFYLLGSFNENTLYLFFASVGAFLVGGASLNVAALNCELMLLLTLYVFFILQKKKQSVIVSSSSLIGAAINLASPGNYIRHGWVAPNYNVFHCIKKTVYETFYSFVDKSLKTPFLIFGIIILIFFLKHVNLKQSFINFVHPFLSILIVFFSVIIVNFPVYLGYASEVFPDRCVFVQDIAIYFFSFLWLFFLAGWVNAKYGRINFTKEVLFNSFVLLFLSSVFIMGPKGNIGRFTTLKMIWNISNGKLVEFVKYEEDLIDEIVCSKEENLVIRRSSTQFLPFFKSIGLTEDSNFWVNEEMASFYGKKSISLIVE